MQWRCHVANEYETRSAFGKRQRLNHASLLQRANTSTLDVPDVIKFRVAVHTMGESNPVPASGLIRIGFKS